MGDNVTTWENRKQATWQTKCVLLSDEDLREVEETARAQNKKPAVVVTEAVSQYLKDRKWARFVECNEQRARDLGITEEDIPRLIAETRLGNEQRGRE